MEREEKEGVSPPNSLPNPLGVWRSVANSPSGAQPPESQFSVLYKRYRMPLVEMIQA